MPRKTISPPPKSSTSLSSLTAGWGERYAVLCIGFGAWDRPDPLFEIDLQPLHGKLVIAIIADDVSRADGTEDDELERSCGNAGACAQVLHERTYLGVRERGMVFDLPHLRLLRQQLVEVAAPPSGISPRR